MSAAPFELLPLYARTEVIIKDNPTLTLEEVEQNVRPFFSFIQENPSYVEEIFSWFGLLTKGKARKKPKFPLAVKYLHYRGLNVVVPFEEVKQVEAFEKWQEGQVYSGKSQPWHDYADAGFDVFTDLQYNGMMTGKDYTWGDKTGTRGLVLLSVQPGPKANTRALDPTDPIDWVAKKKEFDYRCACCGVEEGKFGGKNDKLVRLEKGHIDPRKGWSHSNIIPQCPSCNNHKDDEVWGPPTDGSPFWTVVEKIKR